MTSFKNKALLFLGLLGSVSAITPVQAQTPDRATYNTGLYYNLHRQEERFGGGIFTGPVFTPATGKASFEFNAYAGFNLTGANAPVRVRLGAVAGVSVSQDGAFEYASPTIRLAPALKNEKLKLLNNFYVVATPSFKNPPTIYAGYAIPLGGKGKTSSALLMDFQRYP